MLKFVIGERGSGKTEYCIKKAAESGRSIIIVPEQVSHREESMLLSRLGVFGLGSVEVLSFGQMARRVLSLSDNAACRHIDNAGKVMLLQKIITEGDEFSLLKGNEEEKSVCVMKIISELKRYNVTADDVDAVCEKITEKALCMKLSEISAAYRKFEENIKGKFINDDDNAVRFAASAYAREKYKDFDVFIDSFSSFTQSEIMCIEMFLSHAKSVTVTLCMDFENRENIEFTACNKTFLRLLKLCRDLGEESAAPVLLKREKRGPAELEYLKDNYFKAGASAYEKEAESIEFFTGRNMLSEIEHVAAKIRHEVKNEGVLYRDIAVLCTEEEKYCEYIKSIFSKYDIKIFPDIKTNIANHPVAAFIKGALDTVVKGYTYQNIFRCVKYGFFDISDRECDILENFALESGVRGRTWSSFESFEKFVYDFFDMHYREGESSERLDTILDAGRKIIEPLNMLRSEMGKSMLVSDKCKAIYHFMTSLQLPQKLIDRAKYFEGIGEAYTAIEYKSVYNKIIDVLDEACSAIGEDKMPSKKFADILSVGISQFEIGKIPAVVDGVHCGSFESIKETSAKIIFVLGMNEGVFPVSVSRTGFLNDFDRQRLLENDMALASDAAGKAMEGEYLIYRLFTSAKKLYLSCSASTIEGVALREAWALQKIKALVPKALVSDDMIEKNPLDALSAKDAAFENLIICMAKGAMLSEEYSAAYRWFKENPPWDERLLKAEQMLTYKNRTVDVQKDILDEIYGGEMVTAVTRLEKFSACPFSYYMRYVLNARERKVFKFEAKDAGVFLHSVAEVFSRRLESAGKSWFDVTDGYIKSEVREILSEDGGEFKRLVQIAGKRGEAAFSRLCTVAEFAVSVIAQHIQRGKFQPMGYEIRFSENGRIKPVTINLPDGKKVKLTGVIDRLDTLERADGKYFRIIDYKTGSRDFDLGEVYHGITLQLAVYMCAAASKSGGKPAGMLYFKFKNPDVNDDPFLNDEKIKEEKMKKVSLSGLVISDSDVLSDMDVSEKFDFLPVKKKKDGTFSGSIASAESFEDLRKYVIKTVTRLAGEIFSGKCDIAPYKMRDDMPCAFCPYKAACNFDGALGCRHRSLSKLDKDEIWDNIKNSL